MSNIDCPHDNKRGKDSWWDCYDLNSVLVDVGRNDRESYVTIFRKKEGDWIECTVPRGMPVKKPVSIDILTSYLVALALE